MSTTGPPDGLDSPGGNQPDEQKTTPIRRLRATAVPGPAGNSVSDSTGGDAESADHEGTVSIDTSVHGDSGAVDSTPGDSTPGDSTPGDSTPGDSTSTGSTDADPTRPTRAIARPGRGDRTAAPPPAFGDPARRLPPPAYAGGPGQQPALPGSPDTPWSPGSRSPESPPPESPPPESPPPESPPPESAPPNSAPPESPPAGSGFPLSQAPISPPPPTYGGDPGARFPQPAPPPAGQLPTRQRPTGQPPTAQPPTGPRPKTPPPAPSPLDSPAFGAAPPQARPAPPPGGPPGLPGPLAGLPAAGADWYGLDPAAGATPGAAPGSAPGHRAPPPAWHQVEDWLQPAKSRRQRRIPRPSGTVLTVAAVLVVVAAAGAGGYALVSGQRPAPKPPQASTGIADAFFAAAAGAPTDGLIQQVDDVAAAGGLVVAAGAEGGSLHTHPRFLYSTDAGRNWRLARVESEGAAGPLGTTPQRIVGGPGGWLALSAPGERVTAWTSQDGRSWRRHNEVIDAFRPGDQVRQLARAGQGGAAVGADGSGRPVLWLSGDTRTWQRVDGGGLKLPLRNKESVKQLTYAAGAGQSLLIAGDIATGKTTRAGLWHSTDAGRTWEAVDAPADSEAFGTLHLAADGTKFYALRKGKDGDRRMGVVFESADGKSWQTRGEIPLPDGQDQQFTDLSAGNQQLAALAAGSGGPDAATAVYGSADGGASWRQTGALRAEPGRTLNAMAAAGGGAAVVGGLRRQSTGQDYYLAVTSGSGDPREVDLSRVPGAVNRERSVRALVATSGRAVAVGSTNADAAAWTSTDGSAWRRADTTALGGPGLQTLTGLASGPNGWLAFGRDLAKPLVATSRDGASWQKLNDPGLTGDTGVELAGAASGPKGYVLVGSAGGAPAAWAAPDGRTWKRGDDGLAASGDEGGGEAPIVADVTATSTGYIAVGESGDSGDRRLPEVWTSADGLTWKAKRPPLPQGASAGGLTRVAVKGNTVVAAGVATFTGDRAFTLVSHDAGLTWQAARLPLNVTGRPSYVSAVAATGGGLAVAGNLGGSADGDVLVWTSPDGRAWKLSAPRGAAVSGTGLQRLLGIAGLRGRIVGVGVTTEPRSEHVTLWHGPAA